jgi:heat shock protein HslJ
MNSSAVRIFTGAIASLVMLLTGGTVLADALAGSEWRPAQLGKHAVVDTASRFVRFEAEGRVAGHGGCNRFFGSYQVTDDRISIRPLGATRMACAGPDMNLETAFFQALEQARGFSRDGARLVFTDESGNAAATFRQTDWD